MGQLTRALIVSEALQLAGNTSLTLRANRWLNAWLQRAYASWAWPFLSSVYGPFSLAAGNTSAFLLGGGTNTNDKLYGIRKVRLADSTNNGYQGDIDIVDASLDSIGGEDPLWVRDGRGSPSVCYVSPGSRVSPWTWKLQFGPTPDKVYRFIVTATWQPDDIDASTGGDSVIPLYPNDETMIQALAVRAWQHQDDPRYQAEGNALAMLMQQDRVNYGQTATFNAKLRLSKRFVRRLG